MNNLEQNALRIASLLGWIPESEDSEQYRLIGDNIIGWYRQHKNSLIRIYTSYDGLMPIVFECNSGANNTAIKILDKKVIFGEYDFMNEFDVTRGIAYSTEPLFIHAIQLAVIKYLEL